MVALLPKLSKAGISPKGKLNRKDIKKILRNMLIFITPTLVLYLAQLQGVLGDNITLTLADLIPSTYVIGAFERYLISTVIDYLTKLNDGTK